MSLRSIRSLIAIAPWLIVASVRGSSFEPLSIRQATFLAGAICRGTIVEVRSFRDAASGRIYTKALVRVDEGMKGIFPPVVTLVHPGGVVGNEGERDGFSPQFRLGDERLLLLSRRENGTLFAVRGGASAIKLRRTQATQSGPAGFDETSTASLLSVRGYAAESSASGLDVTDQAGPAEAARRVMRESSGGGVSGVVGLLSDTDNIASRFLAPDRGDGIPYYIDAEYLPAAISLTQATNAVAHAFSAWAGITSLRFTFAGITNFGTASSNINTNDGAIRVQLHNFYGGIVGGSTTLGIGGFNYTSLDAGLFPRGGAGGRVGTNEFHRTTCGYVVLNHNSASMQTLSTFEEVLCHEIGHALGMAHSSENGAETNSVLLESIMYYTVHGDGRGAQFGAYDPPVIRQSHPVTNTPPFAFDRVIYAVTSPSAVANPQVNQVELKGYDLQGTPLSKTLCATTSNNGTFVLNSNTLTYSPVAAFADTSPFDPASTAFYDRTYVRFDDGTNMSPPVQVRVLQYLLCTKPNGAPDGVPDSWRLANFGNSTPTPGVSGASDDPDGDGHSNIQEFLLGTNPNSASSRLGILSFDASTLRFAARPYSLYEIEGSAAFANWVRFGSPLLPTTANGLAVGFSKSATNFQFFRVRSVP